MAKLEGQAMRNFCLPSLERRVTTSLLAVKKRRIAPPSKPPVSDSDPDNRFRFDKKINNAILYPNFENNHAALNPPLVQKTCSAIPRQIWPQAGWRELVWCAFCPCGKILHEFCASSKASASKVYSGI